MQSRGRNNWIEVGMEGKEIGRKQWELMKEMGTIGINES